jgi:hypothetical protein
MNSEDAKFFAAHEVNVEDASEVLAYLSVISECPLDAIRRHDRLADMVGTARREINDKADELVEYIEAECVERGLPVPKDLQTVGDVIIALCSSDGE